MQSFTFSCIFPSKFGSCTYHDFILKPFNRAQLGEKIADHCENSSRRMVQSGIFCGVQIFLLLIVKGPFSCIFSSKFGSCTYDDFILRPFNKTQLVEKIAKHFAKNSREWREKFPRVQIFPLFHLDRARSPGFF